MMLQMPHRQQGVVWMDGLNLLHEVASLGSLPCTCSGDGNHPAMLSSWVLPSACKGTGTKTPPPLWELPGITQRGRACDEVMNRVVGTWVIQGWGHIRRLNVQIELGQHFIISLPFTASASTKQSLTWGLHKIRRH